MDDGKEADYFGWSLYDVIGHLEVAAAEEKFDWQGHPHLRWIHSQEFDLVSAAWWHAQFKMQNAKCKRIKSLTDKGTRPGR